MKNSCITIFTILLVFNILILNSYARWDNIDLEATLNALGIEGDYSENINNYISDLKLTDDKVNDIIENAQNISNIVNKANSSEFSLSDYYNIYNNGMEIADILNVDIKLDFYEKEFVLVNEVTEETLLAGNVDTVKDIYSNYLELGFDKEINTFVAELYEEIIVDEIATESNEKDETYESENNIEQSWGNYTLEGESGNESEKINENSQNQHTTLDEEVDIYVEEIEAVNQNNKVEALPKYDIKIVMAVISILAILAVGLWNIIG